MVAGRLTRRPRPTDSSRLPLAFWTAWAMADCEGAATSVAAIRPTARVRASAAALKLALLFILFTPNRNFGHLVAAGHAHDRTDRRGRLATLVCKSMRSEEHTSELTSLMRISYAIF